MEKFKEYVRTASNGRQNIEIFLDTQAYNDQTASGAIVGGYIELACTSNVVLIGWVPGSDMLSIPFLFKFDWQSHEILSRRVHGRDSCVIQVSKGLKS